MFLIHIVPGGNWGIALWMNEQSHRTWAKLCVGNCVRQFGPIFYAVKLLDA